MFRGGFETFLYLFRLDVVFRYDFVIISRLFGDFYFNGCHDCFEAVSRFVILLLRFLDDDFVTVL